MRPGHRRQAPGELERADGRRARRRRRRARARRTTWTPRAPTRARPARGPARRRRAPAAHLTAAGSPSSRAFLEDHAFLLEALITLYEATFEERWFRAARADRRRAARCASPTPSTAASSRPPTTHEALIARRKEIEDHPIPSGASSAALGLLRLALLTGEARYEDAAVSHLLLVHPLCAQHPQAFAHVLQALDLHVGPAREVALAGPADERRGAGRGRARRRCARASCSPAAPTRRAASARRPAARGPPRRSTDVPRPTSASASPAARRSPDPPSWRRCSRLRPACVTDPTRRVPQWAPVRRARC